MSIVFTYIIVCSEAAHVIHQLLDVRVKLLTESGVRDKLSGIIDCKMHSTKVINHVSASQESELDELCEKTNCAIIKFIGS